MTDTNTTKETPLKKLKREYYQDQENAKTLQELSRLNREYHRAFKRIVNVNEALRNGNVQLF